MKRVILIIIGLILIVLGLGSLVAGSGIAATIGSDGKYTATAGTVKTSGYALVFNDFTVDTGGGKDAVAKVAEFTAGASAPGGKPLFIGVGPAAKVAKYLDGVPRDIVSDVTEAHSHLVPIPGTQQPSAPADQTFWTAQGTGVSPTVKLPTSENQSLVIMNQDASQPVNATLRVGVTSSKIFPLGIALAILGLLATILGIWLLVRARKSRKKVDAAPGNVAYSQEPPQAPLQPGTGPGAPQSATSAPEAAVAAGAGAAAATSEAAASSADQATSTSTPADTSVWDKPDEAASVASETVSEAASSSESTAAADSGSTEAATPPPPSSEEIAAAAKEATSNDGDSTSPSS